MKQILYTEWLKLKSYKAFLIISIFFGIGVLATNYIVFNMFNNIVSNSKAGMLMQGFNPFEFKYVWQTVSYTSGYLLLLPALLLVIIVTNEFAFKTNKQNIIDGWNRIDFFNAKISIALIFSIVSTLLVFATALVFALNAGKPFSFDGFSHLGFFFLKSLSYNLFAVLIAVWIRKTGVATGIFFVYFGAENIVSTLLDAASMKLKDIYKLDFGGLGDYLPMNASDSLLTFPSNPLAPMTKDSIPTQFQGVVVLFAFLYLMFFYFLSKRNIIKKDL